MRVTHHDVSPGITYSLDSGRHERLVRLWKGDGKMLRLLRGRVVIREDMGADFSHLKHIVVPGICLDDHPTAAARRRTWHRGKVLAFGDEAVTKLGAKVERGFDVGDEVIFHWVHKEDNWTIEWLDGKLAAVVPQECVDCVLEADRCGICGVHPAEIEGVCHACDMEEGSVAYE